MSLEGDNPPQLNRHQLKQLLKITPDERETIEERMAQAFIDKVTNSSQYGEIRRQQRQGLRKIFGIPDNVRGISEHLLDKDT